MRGLPQGLACKTDCASPENAFHVDPIALTADELIGQHPPQSGFVAMHRLDQWLPERAIFLRKTRQEFRILARRHCLIIKAMFCENSTIERDPVSQRFVGTETGESPHEKQEMMRPSDNA